MNETTVINIRKTTRERLKELGGKGDSYDTIITRLLNNGRKK